MIRVTIMFALGIIIHLTFLYSIFDIYFKSPIVQNVVPYQPQHEAIADRLVLFVVDGLRAESFVNYTTMKYTRSIANTKGRWGISHTQVPTESRPGHVALIAGFYEDPSAVFKGWKENLVDFDSVFNQSAHTWSWGTNDIINLFTKGITEDHIEVQGYDPYDQEFSTNKNTTMLDTWVFDKVKEFFEEARNDSEVFERLHQKKIVFFLHLLGTDTVGHTYKPKSPNFLITVAHVDEGIKEMEKLFRDFYNDDGKTTFLMTSDHGMTDWGILHLCLGHVTLLRLLPHPGLVTVRSHVPTVSFQACSLDTEDYLWGQFCEGSHGAGENHETETPYVIWGSGVQRVKAFESYTDPSDMSEAHRTDINQVDLTPLMSTILSIPVPVNSIGKPINGLLEMTLSNRAKSMYSISRQLASQYDTKRLEVETNALPCLYVPYEPFSMKKHDEMISFTEQLLKDQDYEELIVFSNEIIHLSLTGLRYYHDYYQRPLLFLVTLSFLGWIVRLLRMLAEQKVNSQADATTIRVSSYRSDMLKYVRKAVCLSLFCLGNYLVFAQNLPIQYYIYIQMPLLLWYRALVPFDVWMLTYKQLKGSGYLRTIFIEVFSYIVGCFALGVSFTHRWTLSIPVLGMGIWPCLSSTSSHIPKAMMGLWALGSCSLSGFSFMRVVGKETFIELVLMAGFLWLFFLVVHWSLVLKPLNVNGQFSRELVLTAVQIVMLLTAMINIFIQARRFEKGTPVSYFDQAFAWAIAATSFFFPMLFTRNMVKRLISIASSLLTFYLMMSVSHEGLFMLCLSLHAMCWVVLEFSLLNLETVQIRDCVFGGVEKHKDITEIYAERSLSHEDFRRAFFFMIYIILSFFGTGNIASLNSFEIRWVTCFVTSYQPFLITTMILLKTFSPFMMVGCCFVAVQTLTEAPIGCLNTIVLIFSNLMGIQFLYNVRNTGSWLEIGTSISHFVIVQLITVFIVIINKIAKFYTDFSIAGHVFNTDDEPEEKVEISERKQHIYTTVARTEHYLRERRIPELIRFLLTKVIAQNSNNPVAYLEKLLDDCMLFRAGHGIAPVLYERRHLEAVVKSFDPGQRGWMSAGQVRRAYTTIGLTPNENITDKVTTDVVLDDLEMAQEDELFRLLSAGTAPDTLSNMD